MSFRTLTRILAVAALTGGLTGVVSAQNDAVVSRIVDEFNLIEGQLPQMQQISYDASYADTEWGLGQVTVWANPNTGMGKMKNVLQLGESTEQQEMWIRGDTIIFVYERFEWHGNQDTVEVDEKRFYMDGGRVIREMSRRGSFRKGQNYDISNTPHQIENNPDFEYAQSLYNDKVKKMDEAVKVGKAMRMRPQGSLPLSALPYRLLFNTLSPDSRYAVAWSFPGVSRPDWNAFNRDKYAYLERMGNPDVQVTLINMANGAVLGDLGGGVDPEGRFFSSAEWSQDGQLLFFKQDARWFTSVAKLFRVGQGYFQQEADLVTSLSGIAMNKLREINHPYTIDNNEADGFIDVKDLNSQGRLVVDYNISSKFEGDRYNALIEMVLDYQFGDGSFHLVSANLPNYVPLPSSWASFASNIATKASQWISNPPLISDSKKLDTVFDHGVIYLYNQFGGQLGQEAIELIIRRPLFLSGPHSAAFLDKWNRFEFGHYDPVSIAMITEEFNDMIGDPSFVSATQVLYNTKFRPTVLHYQEALQYWNNNPDQLQRQTKLYLDQIANKTLPEYGYQLENNLAWNLAEKYHSDIDNQVYFSTALKFWVRRAADGTYKDFANLLQRGLQAYDRAYYEQNGIPGLMVDPYRQQQSGGGGGSSTNVEITMNEEGAIGINSKIPLNLGELKKRLSGLEVVQATISEEGSEYPAFRVLSGGQEVLLLSDYGTGDPASFTAKSRNLRLPSGIGTGDTFGTVYGRQYPLGLEVALETDVNAVIAEAPGSEHIIFYFRPRRGERDQIRDPLSPPLEELSNLVLEEIIWRP